MNYLKISKYFNMIKISNDKYFCYHTLFGNSLICTEQHINFLNQFKKPLNLYSLDNNYIEKNSTIIETFIKKRYLIEINFNEEELKRIREEFKKKIQLEMPFSGLGFFLTNKCNFSCKYCVIHNYTNINLKNYKFLRFNSVKNIIDCFYNNCINIGRQNVEIGFTGGEPMLNWKTLKEIVEYIDLKYGSKINTNFLLNSNIVLLDENSIKFLKKYNFSISCSLDGIGKFNDLVRHYKNGKGTYYDIINVLNVIKKFEININALSMTLTEENFPMEPETLLDLCKNYEIKNLRVELDLLKPINNYSPEELVNKLMLYEDVGNKYKITISGYWKNPFLTLLFSKDITKRISFCLPFQARVISINPDGTLSICAYAKEKIGNFSSFNNLWSSLNYLNSLEKNWIGDIEECKGCSIEGFCIGNCYITRESTKNNIKNFNYRCEVQKLATYKLINYYFKGD